MFAYRLKKEARSGAVRKGQADIAQPPMKVEVIDAIGAEDSFDAVLYGYLNVFDRNKCLRIAIFAVRGIRSRRRHVGQIRINELDH